jgi:hypothetical protein
MTDDCQKKEVFKNKTDFGPGKCEDKADANFDIKKAEAKSDFDKACDLYRNYVGTAESPEERLRRINRFRCG